MTQVGKAKSFDEGKHNQYFLRLYAKDLYVNKNYKTDLYI